MKISYLTLALLLGATPVAVQAQESPTATWGNSVTWRGPIDRSVDIQRAEAQKRARAGGYGPAEVNTTYNGEVTNNTEQTYNGTVSNSSATNAVNLNSFESRVENGSGQVGVTFTTGSTSYQATQNAAAQNASSQNGSASNGSGSATSGNQGGGF
jgi:hypothetical protein